MILPRSYRILPVLATGLLSTLALAQESVAPTPPAPVRARIHADAPKGPWVLTVENTGNEAARIPAHAGLLQLTIELPLTEEDAKRKRPKASVVTCGASGEIHPDVFPDHRALVLEPGQRWVETVDPLLYCFGSKAEAGLVAGATVRGTFGWPQKGKVSARPPFVAQSLKKDSFLPVRALAVESVVLPTPPAPSGFAPASSGAPLQVHLDSAAPRLTGHLEDRVDARSPATLTLRFNVKNEGLRPTWAALRPRMIELWVTRPDGSRWICPATSWGGGIPRDLFAKIAAQGTTTLAFQPIELCPLGTFDRPGLYEIRAALNPADGGEMWGLQGYVAPIAADNTARVRLGSARQPFYSSAPQAQATSQR